MDIKNYISSGVLEDYLLGFLNGEQRKEVELNAKKYPEIQAELDAFEKTLSNYAQLHGITPPPGLKGKILNKINGSSVSNVTQSTTTAGINYLPLLLGITGLLLLGSLFYAFNLSNDNNKLKKDLNTVQAELSTLKKSCAETEQRLNEVEEKVDILRHSSNRSIIMNGTDNAPEAIAAVHWNEEEKVNYLDLINLPTPPSGKQYQLWAIVDGAPVDMGVFDQKLEPGVFVKVPFIEKPQAFAITLEDEGGHPTPNLEQLYVIGNVG